MPGPGEAEPVFDKAGTFGKPGRYHDACAAILVYEGIPYGSHFLGYAGKGHYGLFQQAPESPGAFPGGPGGGGKAHEPAGHDLFLWPGAGTEAVPEGGSLPG